MSLLILLPHGIHLVLRHSTQTRPTRGPVAIDMHRMGGQRILPTEVRTPKHADRSDLCQTAEAWLSVAPSKPVRGRNASQLCVSFLSHEKVTGHLPS